ncbi:hypothetical protein I3760_03G270400 [Carya illinoinensis]|nr:hypothetical protein I3760_03G270400 [Carya illinoinensis]KAG2719527.1 hypothetical protein I3760_03G270400 [Carya illinoinensis]
MLPNDPHQSGDGDGKKSPSAGTEASRRWRRSTLCISIAISLRKGPIGDGDGETSPSAGTDASRRRPSPSAGTDASRRRTSPSAGNDVSRRWRRSTLCISIAISLRKGPIGEKPTLPSPSSCLPYAPCPQEHVPAAAGSNQCKLTSPSHVIDVRSDKGEEEIHEEGILPDDRMVQDQDVVRNIVKERDLNSLRKLGGVDWAVTLLAGSHDMQDGIDGSEVQQAWSTTNNVPIDEKGFWHFFRDVCFSYQNVFLFISAVLAFAIDIKEHGPKYGWHDGVAILVAAVLIIAFFSVGKFLQEGKKKKTLLENMNKRDVEVVRSGALPGIYTTISDVVVGDIVVLKSNNRVPADGLLVEGEDLEVDEVLKPKIDRDQNPFLFSGSKVIKGRGRMLVTSVGDNTAMGKALSFVTHDPEEKTLLQARIEKTNDYIEFLGLSVSVLIAFVMFIRLFCHRHNSSKDLPEIKGNVSVDMVMKILGRISVISQGKIWILTSALTAMLIGIQHGMQLVITISLCHWKEMVQSEADIHNLSACGTMGLVTVIYIESTGGLMCELEARVDKIFVDQKDISNCHVNSETGHFVREALHQGLIGLSVLAPTIPFGLCTRALSSWLRSKTDLSTEDWAQSFDILECTESSSVKKVGGVLMRRKDKEEQILHLHWNGAASTILGMCSHYYDSMGERHAIQDQLTKFEQMIKEMEGNGLRPIAFAHRQNENRELVEEGLNLLALVGLKYTCQEETRSAVEVLRNAGVCIKLVSEDEPPAVRAIACGLGIFTPGSNNVELRGEQIRELIRNGNIEEVELANVIGSCLPEDKLCMIQKLQQRGHIVAFFGGLTTSDALALKEANLGITRNAWSTELARQSSDVTVKSFDSLGTILKYGRCAYHNIQQFSQLQLTTCISGLLVALVTTTITGTSPITGLALFWVNWQMCLLGSQVMLMELKSQELLANKPVIGPQSLLTEVVWINIAIQVIYQGSVFLIFQFTGQDIPDMNDSVRETMIFNAFLLCQIFHQFNAMDLGKKQVLSDVLHNWPFLVTLAAVMAMQVMVIELLGDATSFVRLNAVQWVSCFLVAALSWGFDLALKSIANVFTKCFAPHFSVLIFIMLLLSAMPALVDVVNRYDNIPSGCE